MILLILLLILILILLILLLILILLILLTLLILDIIDTCWYAIFIDLMIRLLSLILLMAIIDWPLFSLADFHYVIAIELSFIDIDIADIIDIITHWHWLASSSLLLLPILIFRYFILMPLRDIVLISWVIIIIEFIVLIIRYRDSFAETLLTLYTWWWCHYWWLHTWILYYYYYYMIHYIDAGHATHDIDILILRCFIRLLISFSLLILHYY